MSVLDDLIFSADMLIKFFESAKLIPEQSHTITTLEARKCELRELWGEVKAKYAQCIRFKPKEGEDPLDVEVLDSKAETKLKNEPIETTKPPPSPNFTSQQSMSAHCLKLPPCDTEVFQGDYLSWPAFRDMFDAVYIKHPKIGNVEKLFHLRAKTKGDAYRIVSQFPLINTSFALAWEALRSTYENTRILVNNQIKNIFNLPIAHEESARSLRNLQRTVNDSIAVLKAHHVKTENWDPILVFACSNKLPKSTLTLWEQSLADPTKIQTWEQLNKFLNSRFQVLESISDTSSSTQSKVNSRSVDRTNNIRKSNTVNNFLAAAGGAKCKVCLSNHKIADCAKFLEMAVPSRISFIHKNKICNNCLSQNHLKSTCASTYSCKICKKRHHSLLHLAHDSNNSNKQSTSQTPLVSNSQISAESQTFVPQNSLQNYCVFTQKRVLLATALVSVLGRETNHIVRALIDPGSETTFISEAIQKRLNLSVIAKETTISGISGNNMVTSKKLCSFSFTARDNPQVTVSAQAFVLKTLTNNLPSSSFSLIDSRLFGEMHLADPTFNKSAQVDLLIGADLYPSIIRNGIKVISDSLVAQNTMFGWILSGPVPDSFQSFHTFTVSSKHSPNTLDSELRKFWELEELPAETVRSKEDSFCENLFKKTTFRRSDGRFVVRLPFKTQHNNVSLGSSRYIALKQFLRSERSLSTKADLKDQYSKVIKEYLSLGHMRKVNASEKTENGQTKSFYLPHHAVVKPESTTTKVRVVFNASNASSSGVSLNDILHPGPILQQDLTSLILRWRFYQFVFNADIQKMYRQILIDPQDTPFQRILYRSSPNSDIEDFELLTVTFGVNCAPYLAIRTLLQLAEEGKKEFPLASSILETEMYVDDVLSGAHSVHTAKRAQYELITLLNSAGFPLMKWTSNISCLLDHLPREQVFSENFLKLDEDSSMKTLGVRWNAIGDNFYFDTQKIELSKTPSKREVFSQIARLFDPAGWLAPVVIIAKILLQTIWIEGTEWDEAITAESWATWKNFVEALPDIQHIKIPRWVNFSPESEIQFHGFCDSSQRAYAAALYIRVSQSNGSTTSHLLCAKSKVAPIKSVSLPRLELCGALLLSKLIKSFVNRCPVNSYQTFLWTDSSIVLAWLKKPPCVWKTFIANRTSEILDNVGNAVWRHVSSTENPADLATRGVLASNLKHNSLWWKGPSWLSESEVSWPKSVPLIPNEPDFEKRPVISLVGQLEEDILDRFSSLPRALRVISIIFHFYLKCRKRQSNFYFERHASHEAIDFVKNRLILLSQSNHYHKEHNLLLQKSPLHRRSSLLCFNPFLDSNNIMRINGRLVNSDLSYNERHPIILPYNSRFTYLLVQFIHQLSLHGGNSLMLRLVRQSFWVPKLKNLIKSCIRQCKTCIINRKESNKQLMASLPPERCRFSPPFTFTGIDFAGPFIIKSYNARNCRMSKGYACIFVCFATKAIHLEAASDLSSEVFLAAFARFVARRGLPKAVYSDNGTNFIGADAKLRKDFRKFLSSIPREISAKYGVEGFEWNFIPPGAPHMGGLWEAGVKSFKHHFRKLGVDLKFTFEEFSTLLARIEACLNSRPISSMSNDSSDLLALTPGHFIRGTPMLAFPEPNLTDSSLSLINRWEKLKSIHQQFCQRWKHEYLKELHQRSKWKSPTGNFKVNDLVVIRDKNLPSTEWRLGRVTKVHPGSDGLVRVVTVRTQNGELTRPIVKLCLLPQQ